MSFSIGELVGTISLNDQFSGPTEKVADTLGLAGQSFGAVAGLAGIAASAIAGATAAIVMLGQRGAAVQDVRGAFDNLTTAAGSTSEVMLGALRSGTLGTISDFDLASKATAVLGSGMIKSADDMGTLAAGAKLLADRTGGDTAEAFDTLTGAMASGRVATLKQMGVFVDTKGAIQEYANALGVSVDKLTAEQRAEAISTATLAALKAQLLQAGPATADFGDQIDRGKVAIQNFTDNLAVAVATSPVVAAGLDGIATGVAAAFGGSQQTLVQTLMGFVNDFAIGLTYVAQVAVTVAGGFVQAWYLMKTVVLGVITAVSGFATALVTIVTGLAEMAASVPGASAVVGDLAAGARALQADMAAVTLSLAAETAEAARGAAGHSELQGKLDAVGGAILIVRDNMEAARGAAAGMNEENAAAVPPLAAIGETATLTAAQMDAIALAAEQAGIASVLAADAVQERFMTLQDELTLANLTGLDARLFEINTKRQEELLGLENLTFASVAEYDKMVALVQTKYGIMSAVAAGHFTSVTQAAAAAGFETQVELQATADNAKRLYDAMTASGKFSFSELQRAHAAAKAAEDTVNQTSAQTAMGLYMQIASVVQGILQTAFGGTKAAAYASAVVDTAAAVVKALASAPPPFNYALAAGVYAAGLVQINKIASTSIGSGGGAASVKVPGELGFGVGVGGAVGKPGYAEGTGPGGMFRNFGRVSTIDVHGPEAIVTPKQGASLAGMVGAAIERAQQHGGRQSARPVHVTVNIGPEKLYDLLSRASARGDLLIHPDAVVAR